MIGLKMFQFHYLNDFCESIVPEMFTKTIFEKYVCKDVLDNLVYKVVQTFDHERVQRQLNQLSILSSSILTNSTSLKRKYDSIAASPQKT